MNKSSVSRHFTESAMNLPSFTPRLDTQYAIKYDPENIITYIGIERNVITYDFVKKIWEITVGRTN